MNQNNRMPFGKKNYVMMLTGIMVLVIGFIIIGLDNEPFGFGFLGLTLGPIVVMVGFIIEILAILHHPKEK